MAAMADDISVFEQQLAQALETKARALEEDTLPKFKPLIRDFKSSFDAIHNLLQRKGLLRPDPYNYEEKISGIELPSDAQFLDSERDEQISIRLAKMEPRIDYLINFFEFSLDNLNLGTLKLLVKFFKYINWRNLSEASTQPTTRGLAELLAKIKRGTDQLSINIVRDAQDQTSRIVGELMSHLKRVTEYKREEYKFAVRTEILANMSLPPSPDPGQLEPALRQIKSAMSSSMPNEPYIKELIVEVFAENDPDEGPSRREGVLKSLQVEAKQQKKNNRVDLRPIIVEGVRAVSGSSRSLDELVRKLNDNVVVLESRKLSFGEAFKRALLRLFGRDEEDHQFTVEYVDESTAVRHTETVAFDDFTDKANRKARLFAGILAKHGNAWRKIEDATEDQLLSFVNKETQELSIIVRRAASLDTLIRAEVTREQRSQLRSINDELTKLREQVSRGRKKAHEYVARHDEIQQLKKLGIDTTQ